MTIAPLRPPLTRSGDRMIAGVCSGLAQHLGWPVRNIRIAMALAALLGGSGAVFYAWLWIMVPTADEAARRNTRRPASPIAPAVSQPFEPTTAGSWRAGPAAAAAGPAAGAPQGNPDSGGRSDFSGHPDFSVRPDFSGRTPGGGTDGGRRGWSTIPYGKEILLGSGLLLVAGILIAQMLGANVPLGTIIPAAAVLGGAAIAWMQLDENRRTGLLERAGARQQGGWVRVVAGLALVVAGVLVTVSGSGSWEQTWLALLASVAVLGGVALVLLPWGLKFWRDLEIERAGRVRETERAEIAAHLHDSVLQTLALIQRRAGNEHDVVRLARAQERELRGWLYRDAAADPAQLSERIKAAAAEVEDALGNAVEVVTVGDTLVAERHEALVQAAREAMFNAARHGGGTVSVYAEISGDGAEVFVRDRGPGFDPQALPPDRFGVRESIIGRMKRHGGSAVITSSIEGTEVRLTLPGTENVEAKP